MTPSRLVDALIRLRLRRPLRRLRQRAHDGAPGQLDLEIVVAAAARFAQNQVGRTQEVLPRCRRSLELRFRFAVAPGLVGYPTEREARLLDRLALDIQTDRDRHERERV